jgi:hypothetical protein
MTPDEISDFRCFTADVLDNKSVNFRKQVQILVLPQYEATDLHSEYMKVRSVIGWLYYRLS